MSAEDVRLVACPACEGEGCEFETVYVYEPGCGFSHPDTLPTGPCKHCDGTGGVYIKAWPITLDDLLVKGVRHDT